MKMKTGMSRRLRYGGVTATLTAAIIAIVIIVNVIFTALAQKKLWYTDLTPEVLFTLSDNCITLMKDGDPAFENSESPIQKIDEFRAEDKKNNPDKSDADIKKDNAINIIFCDDKLTWEEDVSQRYVKETAEQLSEEFPGYFNIEYVDIVRNPTAVTKYGKNIATSSVIIECGSEFRLRNLRSFYVFSDTSEDTPWAYNGEKILAASIMAVTRTDTPVACIVENHSDPEDILNLEPFCLTLENAGYETVIMDLSKEEVPDNCRLMVIYSPTEDFAEKDGVSDVDEIKKIEKFLEGTNALMVFMDPEQTYRLENLEGYLEEWGVKFNRSPEQYPHIVRDLTQCIDSSGLTIRGNYMKEGLGAEITHQLSTDRRQVYFPTAMSLSYSSVVEPSHYVDENDSTKEFDFGRINIDGTYREIFEVLVSGENAVAEANGSEVETATKKDPLKLMTVSVEGKYIQESDYTTTNLSTYVFAMGCTDFISSKMLHGQYGNNMFLEYMLRIVAHEPVPVGLTFKPFGDYSIDTVEKDDATMFTVILTVVPLVLSLGTGIFVIVRRKNR